MAERGKKDTPRRGDTEPTQRQRVVHDVVVSYSRSDGDRVKPFVFELQQAGVSIWIDQKDIDGAQPWGQKIAEAIDSCQVLLFMASATSVTRQGVIREVAVAYDAEKAVLPVHLEPVELPSALRYQLAGIQHIDMHPGADQHEALNATLRALRGLGVEVTPRSQRERLAAADTGIADGALVSAERPIVRDTPTSAKDHFADEVAPSAAEDFDPEPEPTAPATARATMRLDPPGPAKPSALGGRGRILLAAAGALVVVAILALALHSSGSSKKGTLSFAEEPTNATSYVLLTDNKVDTLSLHPTPDGKPLLDQLPQGTGGIVLVGDPTAAGWQQVQIGPTTGYLYAKYLHDGSAIAEGDRGAVVRSLGYEPKTTVTGPKGFAAIVGQMDFSDLGHLELVVFFQGGHLLGVSGLPVHHIRGIRFNASTGTVDVTYGLFNGPGGGTSSGKTVVVRYGRLNDGMQALDKLPPYDPPVVANASTDAYVTASPTGHL